MKCINFEEKTGTQLNYDYYYLLIALSHRRRKAIHVSFTCAIPQRIQFMLLRD